MNQRSLVTLDDLPQELLLHVIRYLDYGSATSLLQTNRLFHRIVSPQDCAVQNKRAFVLTAEFRKHFSSLGCYRCYRTLPYTAFADNQMRGFRGPGGPRQFDRFCVACGVETKIYEPGSRIKRGGKNSWLCGGCWQVKGGKHCPQHGRCEVCLALMSNHQSITMGVDCPLCVSKMVSDEQPLRQQALVTQENARSERELSDNEFCDDEELAWLSSRPLELR